MTDLSGVTAVVTGGNSGIGRAMAIGIAKAGGAVSIWSRNADRNAEVTDELHALGANTMSVSCDVADEAAVAEAMRRTVAELGPLGCFVANAGMVDAPAPIVDTTLESWQRVLRTNLDGAFLCTREAARRFVEQDSGGSIIVVSSTSSRYGAAGIASYAASKTALLGLSRTLAVELARHRVRCNTLIPGWTRTSITSHGQQNPKFMAATIGRTPVRRWAEPDEYQQVAAFLADPTQLFHTGNEVVVDGGYTIF